MPVTLPSNQTQKIARQKAPESLALFRPQELYIVLTPHTYGNLDAGEPKRLLEEGQFGERH